MSSTSPFNRRQVENTHTFDWRRRRGHADHAVAQFASRTNEARPNVAHNPVPPNWCLTQLVEDQARMHPDAPAVATSEAVLTYRDLDIRANRLAYHLRSLAVGQDVLVGLCVERSPLLVVGALGILKAGGAYLPMDPAYPTERLIFMLRDSHAPVLITQQSLAAHLSDGPWQVVILDDDLADMAKEAVEPPVTNSTVDRSAYVIYTSGSTGSPKGVLISHGNLLNLIFWHQRTFSITPADRATQLASPGFDAAVWEIWPYLAAGASLHMPDELTRTVPEALRDWLVAEGITVSFAPTPLAERLMALEWPPETALRLLLTGAELLHHYPRASLPFVLVNNYGPTECTVVATSGVVPPSPYPGSPPSIGRPITNTQIYVLNEDMEPVEDGVPGELHIGGAGVGQGYLYRPALTAQKFIADPFSDLPGARLYKTGDLARFRPDGSIDFLGRIDEQIKIRGYRIEPEEIVTALAGHPDIQGAVVATQESDTGEKQLVAYVVPVAEGTLRDGELRSFLEERLPSYMIPNWFVQLEALPLTPNGKVDRTALPSLDRASIIRDEYFVAPRTPFEERLADIVAGLLGVEQISIDDNFFLLGGHSLFGAQVIARVYDTLGVDLSLGTLFEAPTVSSLALAIEQHIITGLQAMSDEEVQYLLDA